LSNAQIDALYLQGKDEADPFQFYYSNLRPLLVKYASYICKQVLRQIDDHLVTEMVDDLLIEIDKFRGLSRFSTWAHSRFYYRCIVEHRYRDKNLGYSLEALVQAWDDYGPHYEDTSVGVAISESTIPHFGQVERNLVEELFTLTEVQGELSEEQKSIVKARLEGYTFEEIGEQLGITRSVAFHRWREIVSVVV
jgi:RNA polymerase sigma factor (sigma-70 family)